MEKKLIELKNHELGDNIVHFIRNIHLGLSINARDEALQCLCLLLNRADGSYREPGALGIDNYLINISSSHPNLKQEK